MQPSNNIYMGVYIGLIQEKNVDHMQKYMNIGKYASKSKKQELMSSQSIIKGLIDCRLTPRLNLSECFSERQEYKRKLVHEKN